MASQSDGSIHFSVAEPSQHFRLLELPPELVELISSSKAPILHLKSALSVEASSGSLTPVSKSQSNLHLVTHDKSYEVRQVNTSNSVYIIEPSRSKSSSRPDENQETGNTGSAEKHNTSSGLSAIGQVSSVLELQPTVYDVHRLLNQRLHTWTGAEPIERHHDPLASSTKASIFSDIPCPEGDIARAWKDLCAVETNYADHTACFRPSARSARDGWRSLLQGCVSENIDLSLPTPLQSIMKSYDPRYEDDETDKELKIAQALLECLGEMTPQGYCLSRDRIVRWVGSKLLQASYEEEIFRGDETGSTQRMDMTVFLGTWRELLPEAWRADAKVTSLGANKEGRYRLVEDGNSIEYWQGVGDEYFIFHNATTDDTQLTAAAEANTGGGKRKWHEKFQEMRNKKVT